RSRKIKKPVAAGAVVLIDFLEALGQRLVTRFVPELALVIKDRLRKVLPDFVAHCLSRKLARRFFKIAPEFVVGFWPASEADNRHGRRKLAIGGQIVQCGDKFAMGEVARSAEDHNRAWLRHGARRQAFAQWIWFVLISGLIHRQPKLRRFSPLR